MISQRYGEFSIFSPLRFIYIYICSFESENTFTNPNKPEINSGNLFFARLHSDNDGGVVTGRKASSCHAVFCNLEIIEHLVIATRERAQRFNFETV